MGSTACQVNKQLDSKTENTIQGLYNAFIENKNNNQRIQTAIDQFEKLEEYEIQTKCEALRDYIKSWKIYSMKYSDYKSVISEKPFKHIHHVNKNFSEILELTFKISNIEVKETIEEYTSEELEKLVNENLIEIDGDNIKLTNKGLDLANLVWEEFVQKKCSMGTQNLEH